MLFSPTCAVQGQGGAEQFGARRGGAGRAGPALMLRCHGHDKLKAADSRHVMGCTSCGCQPWAVALMRSSMEGHHSACMAAVMRCQCSGAGRPGPPHRDRAKIKERQVGQGGIGGAREVAKARQGEGASGEGGGGAPTRPGMYSLPSSARAQLSDVSSLPTSSTAAGGKGGRQQEGGTEVKGCAPEFVGRSQGSPARTPSSAGKTALRARPRRRSLQPPQPGHRSPHRCPAVCYAACRRSALSRCAHQ